MARDSVGRRLLAALADATPAFTPRSDQGSRRARRLLAALADSTPAFRPRLRTTSDEYTRSATRSTAAKRRARVAWAATMPGPPPDTSASPNTYFIVVPPSDRLLLLNVLRHGPFGELLAAARASEHDASIAAVHDIAVVFVDLLIDSLRREGTVPFTVARLAGAGIAESLTLTQATARAETRTRDLARARARKLSRQLTGALAPVPDLKRVRGLAERLRHELDEAQPRSRSFDLGVKSAQLNLFSQRVAQQAGSLLATLADVTGEDLSQADLTDIDLDGVRWSSRTRWPAGWEDRIRRTSVEIAPDLYEIHSGTHTVENLL
ncbi:hypothetical protein M8542_49485 [Amycolatopsis sp. OK19-0408]|uniref:Uncharacterized protein n=1 Tax=Amycolatopsis iheyensis TaxID=2945988 RepID=A0A9X2NMS0_9PSEU|nr:hypothetical protein [Amycolatopsis iheyensis]MCR6490842.1 hypothetical protein [Amycolatopsis iheyensis]